MRVIVGMSGGVDSSLAAFLLQREGHEVIGATMRIAEGGADAVAGARAVAETLGIPHCVVDLREAFRRRIVDTFAAAYSAGRTPNPCVQCNAEIKFGLLWEALADWGADCMATGHYVRREYLPDVHRYTLRRPRDHSKDQTYVLYRLSQGQLARARFPLGTWTKGEVRTLAGELDLPAAETSESQEICFVPGDYRDFLAARDPGILCPGPIVDGGGRVLGEHRGLAFYTVGQRRGLGIAAGEPLYVLRLRPLDNAVVVGPKSALYAAGARVVNLSWMIPLEEGKVHDAQVRIRYNAPAVPATLYPRGDDIDVHFDEFQPAVTPGQSAVFYRRDRLLGGGFINAAHFIGAECGCGGAN